MVLPYQPFSSLGGPTPFGPPVFLQHLPSCRQVSISSGSLQTKLQGRARQVPGVILQFLFQVSLFPLGLLFSSCPQRYLSCRAEPVFQLNDPLHHIRIIIRGSVIRLARTVNSTAETINCGSISCSLAIIVAITAVGMPNCRTPEA